MNNIGWLVVHVLSCILYSFYKFGLICWDLSASWYLIRAVARILVGEEHLAEWSEAGSHFGFLRARSEPRKILKISVSISYDHAKIY